MVSVYDVGETDGRLWLAMQWIDGRDLRSLLATFGPRLPDRAVALIVQIASALDAVHAAGLIHRDVKPANVLVRDVDGRDHAYLTDFGVAKPPDHSADQLTRTGSVVGTTGYLSPEQIQGGEPGPRSDLYALGCVFFETVTGHPPFAGENELALRWAHANDRRPKISDLRPDLDGRYDQFISTALAIDPLDRFRSGREFAQALTQAHTGEPAPQPAEVPRAPTVVGPPTPLPPAPSALTPYPPLAAYPQPYGTPPPPPRSPRSGGNPLVLVLLALVALGGIAVGALVATGVFSAGAPRTETVISTRVVKPPTSTAAVSTRPSMTAPASTYTAPTSTYGSGTGTSTNAPGVDAATIACDQNISVNNVTSCPFADNVFRAYVASLQANGAQSESTVTAYSPVTHRIYRMRCVTLGTIVDCTGGTNAFVTFPLVAAEDY